MRLRCMWTKWRRAASWAASSGGMRWRRWLKTSSCLTVSSSGAANLLSLVYESLRMQVQQGEVVAQDQRLFDRGIVGLYLLNVICGVVEMHAVQRRGDAKDLPIPFLPLIIHPTELVASEGVEKVLRIVITSGE